ncbi:MAG: nucleotidyltransferase family protein [Gemmatimonadetes bacterium]|nr:nucleotidyltransferase family protein [Gemmatimonadota bacterium]
MGSRQSPDFAGILARISSALDERKIPFMLIGGQAVLVHGEPRLTQDIDVTLGVPPIRLGEILELCESTRLEPLPEQPRTFVQETFVLPADDRATGVRVDFIFSTTPYEAQAIGRAERLSVGGASVPFATPEDLILHKLFAGRARDLEDVRGVVRRKRPEIEWDYLARWGHELAATPGREGLVEQLERLRRGLDP